MTDDADPEVAKPMDPADWIGEVYVRKGELFSPVAIKGFAGPSDARITAAAFIGETGVDDDPVVEARLLFRHGMFAFNCHTLDYANTQNFQIGIRARDHADGEIQMLADALRWLADQIGHKGRWVP